MKADQRSDQSPAQVRQRDFYSRGMSGLRPAFPVAFADLEAAARQKLSPAAFAYVAGGAGREQTMTNNRSGFQKWKILPRMLRDVSQRDLSISLFGRQHPTPFLLAPIGVLELAHSIADLAVARAAAAQRIPMIFSNQASVPMETCAAAMGTQSRWFQLYWSKSNELVASLVRRAEACGCEAIVVTLDTTLLGWRERDLDLAFLPFLQGRGIAQYTSDPVFNQILDQPDDPQQIQVKPPLRPLTIWNALRLMKNYPGNFLQNLRSQRPLRAVRQFINIYSRPSLTWPDLAFLREQTKLPILLKGILHPDDARMALDHGVDGLIVSNHGGRQVDGSVSSIEMLPEIVAAVGQQIPVLLDSGIRGGADAFKALALGATAICIGRPYAYGLALGGQAGVEAVLSNLVADFELTMGLAGCSSISAINHEALRDTP